MRESVVDFLYIGPDKTGSSWLFELLKLRTEIYVPDFKDIYFFDRFFDFGQEWYDDFFRAASNTQIRGEISHDYLFSADASLRIRSYNPKMKLITFLRDPIERSFSHYLYLKRSGITKSNLVDAVRDHRTIVTNSQYVNFLPLYDWAQENDQLFVGDFSELADEEAFSRKVLLFLGLDTDSIQLPGKVREASEPRSYLAARMTKTGANLARALGRPDLVGAVKHSIVSKLLFKSFGSSKPTLTNEEYDFLRTELQSSVCSLAESYPQLTFSWMNKYLNFRQ